MHHPSSLRYAVTGPSPLHYAVAGEIHERREKNKITFDSKLLNSHSQSPDWECIVIETLFCVPKVGFGNEIKGVGFEELKNSMGFYKYEPLENTLKIMNF